MKITVRVTPISGGQSTKVLEVGDETLKEALAKAGIATKGFNFFVGNEPVDIDKPLAIQAKEVNVTATERARGS